LNSNWSPEIVIKQKFLKDYKKNIEGLSFEVIRLNSNIFILEKLLKFPFRIFLSNYYERYFWDLTIHNFFQDSILIAFKLVIDIVN